MAKRSLAVQLDEVVQAMLVSLRPRPEEAPDQSFEQPSNPICKGEQP